jgi:hypothetical protein
MRKLLLASVVVVAAGLASAALVPNASADSATEVTAKDVAQMQRMQDRMSVLLDAHLAGAKIGLKLTDEQAKYWPAFEAAIRDAAKAKADRWRQALERVGRDDHPSPLERMTILADHLEKSAAELRAVVDAGKPLYDSLSDEQKHDFGLLLRDFRPKEAQERGH